MSATGSVRGFLEFDDLCQGSQGYSYNLAGLFETCDHDQFSRHKHTISFKEAFKRLKLRIKESFIALETQTERKVTDFTIGKTFVKQRQGVIFNPMKPSTWSLGGGINGRWQDYKNDNYDGLIVLTCIERDLIPQHTKECNKRAILIDKKTIEANQQNYALALEQALIHFYVFIKPDERLRNQSFDIGNLSKEPYKGGIVYVAYKLEPEPSYSGDEFEAISNQEFENEAAIDRLKLLLEENGLYSCCDTTNDGNSFFLACSDQLSRLKLPKMDHLLLRQLIIPQMRDMSDEKKKSVNLCNESWETYLTQIEKEGAVVGDIVVEAMAKFLSRKIVIYSRSYPNEIREEIVNEEAGVNGPPLLLGKEKLYYQSLKRGDGNVDVKGESHILKRPAPTESAATNQPSTEKKPKKEKKKKKLEDEHKISKSITTPSGDDRTRTEPKVHFIPQQRMDDGAQITGGGDPSNISSSQSLSEPKIPVSADRIASSSQNPSKRKVYMSADEKKLILNSYIKQEIKSDWDKLTETVFLHRHKCLPLKTVGHYEKTLTTASLKQRIKSFLQSVMRGKKENEKDPEVVRLIKDCMSPHRTSQ